MGTKLKSITNVIHWSSATKAAAFCAAWFLLPLWLFFLAATALYASSFFQLKAFLPHFAAVLALAAAFPSRNVFVALFLGGTWYVITCIRELIFVDRASASYLLALMLSFGAAVAFFSRFDSWEHPLVFIWAAAVSVLWYVLAKRVVTPETHGTAGEALSRPLLVSLAVMSFLLWQVGIAAAILPFSVFYQSALLFLVSAALLELIVSTARLQLTRRKLLETFSIFFAVAVLILVAGGGNGNYTPLDTT
jgi:hypothetical protein